MARYSSYDDADVARLQEMARLVADGVPAAIAAAEVAAAMGSVVVTPADGATNGAGSPTAADLVRAARTLDQDFLDRTLEEAFALGTFEHVG
ncbi:hypothetical protein [Ornithinimicrobium panacihumi]|uniref:hypothetical protein n=1 Tax=Ornithinimicrobium panacihumi TaxID=2008449 RepID=UPI003F8C45B0